MASVGSLQFSKMERRSTELRAAARKSGNISRKKNCKSTEYFQELGNGAKIQSHSLFLNGTRAGAVFSREGKSRTNAAIEGCHPPLNPK
jgi:hypothetical protein